MKIEELDKTYNQITLNEIKKHLHIAIQFTDDDDYLIDLLEVAVDIVENDIEANIALANIRASKTLSKENEVTIQDSNLISIQSIELDGVALSGDTYTVDKEDFRFIVSFDTSLTGDIVILYSVGFTASTIKAVLKQCILIKIMNLYDNERSSYTGGAYTLNKAYENMINYYKKIVFI